MARKWIHLGLLVMLGASFGGPGHQGPWVPSACEARADRSVDADLGGGVPMRLADPGFATPAPPPVTLHEGVEGGGAGASGTLGRRGRPVHFERAGVVVPRLDGAARPFVLTASLRALRAHPSTAPPRTA